ncbi:hypothetical protein SODALDRAFT_348495 [Sodiomyces alkalinus F11]|uniref:Peroxisome assembly protein 12 n=1 Tax=Sodiomyces alkalinus (strain CBS 110278 / VKM F-3762 / F11) TaxID=1314773 RepID=A0A3N2Q0B2_SODAK|nr:hypothetical protein SODALDRAFT_348495 [Sodiomyces alkalinus F11]ROT40204.1 hypothetical protein SODALDRAFT_348495 [Sodiomyces alkalinus F11]
MEFVTALRGSIDDQKPSLFELLSEQQLNSLLPPTIRYLLTIATQRYPRYLLRVLNSFDELYALLMLLVERHYLRTRGGSFTENFYGLKREKALHAEIPRASTHAPAIVRDALRLRSRDVWKNLAVMVVLPYLKRKLDEGYEVNAPRALLGAAYTRMPDNPTVKQRLLHYYRCFLTKIYPSVNAGYYFALLAFNLAYLFDNAKSHDPFLWLIGTRVRRMTAEDYRAIEALTAKSGGRKGPAAAPGFRSLLSPKELGPRMLSSLSMLLPLSIFALKFLEWWHASDFAKQLSRKAADAIDLPPPIVTGLERKKKKKEEEEEGGSGGASAAGEKKGEQAATDAEGDESKEGLLTDAETAPMATSSLLPILTVSAPEDTKLCPICAGDIVTPTACQTGTVYCYSCIHRWLEGTHPKQEAFMMDKEGKWESGMGRCAVTGRRVLGGTEGLRRIMV